MAQSELFKHNLKEIKRLTKEFGIVFRNTRADINKNMSHWGTGDRNFDFNRSERIYDYVLKINQVDMKIGGDYQRRRVLEIGEPKIDQIDAMEIIYDFISGYQYGSSGQCTESMGSTGHWGIDKRHEVYNLVFFNIRG
jgi:hypothetical protein